MSSIFSPQLALNLHASNQPFAPLPPDPRSAQALEEILCPQRPVKVVTEAYSEAITAGKNSYVYDAHTYHTKVPPQGIARLIDYYTRPGDAVLDPFCGSGMTGVAATDLGRDVVLSDLSPAAVFIAEQLNTPVDHVQYLEAVQALLSETAELETSLYGTTCRECGRDALALYMVWSFGLVCPKCSNEFVLWDVARDERDSVRESKILSTFDCPHCHASIAKRNLKRTRRYPVQVGYQCCRRGTKESTSAPLPRDLDLLERLERDGLPSDLWYPTNAFPQGINTRQPIAAGITTIDKAYTRRALYAFAELWQRASNWKDAAMRPKLLFTLTSLYQRVTVFSEFRFWGGSGNTANFNVPHIMNEQNVFRTFARKANTISWYFRDAPKVPRRLHVSVRSASELNHLPDASIDYVFTDPPFGGNINYSEMNFLWESWLKSWTDNREEAIVNAVQGKSMQDYSNILGRAFGEAHRVLKKHGWMTVVFHNSSDKVWAALQDAITRAGFEVRGAQTFDKKHGTFKMFVSDNAVGYDLVLHCQRLVDRGAEYSQVNTVADVATFIRAHVAHKSRYVVRYLHVNRKTEFDYRRLYSEWIGAAVAGSTVGLDFESFRRLVDQVRDEDAATEDATRI